MILIAARYVFVFWFLISCHKGDNFVLRQQIETQDQDLYRISACTARCIKENKFVDYYEFNENIDLILDPGGDSKSEEWIQSQEEEPKSFLPSCYKKCSKNTTASSSPKSTKLRKIHENLSLTLLCRDDRSLTFRIMAEGITQSEKEHLNFWSEMSVPASQYDAGNKHDTLYFIKVHPSKDAETYVVYLSDDNLFTIGELQQNTTHNVTAVAIHANHKYSVIAKEQQYKTLIRGYTPGKVNDLQIQSIKNDTWNENRLMVQLLWKPSNDMNCIYDIICFSTDDGGLNPIEINDPYDLYNYSLHNIEFGHEYKLGVRAKSLHRESDIVWKSFSTPSCEIWYNYDYSICAPAAPDGLNVNKEINNNGKINLKIDWKTPKHFPDYYTVRVLDLDDNNHGQFVEANVSKTENSLDLSSLELNGDIFEVHVTAYTRGGNNTAVMSNNRSQYTIVNNDDEDLLQLYVIYFGPILTFAVVGFIWYYIWNLRPNLERSEDNHSNIDDLEKKAGIMSNEFTQKIMPETPNVGISQLQFDLEEKIFFDDSMEIDRSSITLQEILGEGAFGLVRRGIYTKPHVEPLEVAVKMLKDNPSVDDIRAFRQEIKVMKSVDKHPNIVGIIGHCTKGTDEMMLLTEYCSDGSLLDFLRDEWRFNQTIKEFHNYMRLDNRIILPKISGGLTTSNDSRHIEFLNDEMPMTSAVSTATENHSYGYPDICTKGCNCHASVNIMDIGPMNDLLELGKLPLKLNHQQQHQFKMNSLDKSIEIKNCECQRGPKPYIRSIENESYGDTKAEVSQCNMTERRPLSSADFLDIAKQVAIGMEFLAKNKVVHRDLAARNILVTKNRTIKIADFGLSRDIYQENIYKKTGNGKLPIKWLALESMTHQVYTTQSDVWSYGILLYEIATLGGNPYPLKPTNKLLGLLKSGYRMPKPTNCGDELYILMRSCWHENPNERPTFTQIIRMLEVIIFDSPNQVQYIDRFDDEPVKDLEGQVEEDIAYLRPL